MPVQSVMPYLFFSGTTEQAVRHYEKALGAKAEGLVRYGEMGGMPMDEATKSRVANVNLKIGSFTLMAGDVEAGKEASKVSNVEVCLAYDDLDEMKRAFTALGEGGSITMNIELAPWGDSFGGLTDRFGIRWMFIGPAPAGAAAGGPER